MRTRRLLTVSSETGPTFAFGTVTCPLLTCLDVPRPPFTGNPKAHTYPTLAPIEHLVSCKVLCAKKLTQETANIYLRDWYTISLGAVKAKLAKQRMALCFVSTPSATKITVPVDTEASSMRVIHAGRILGADHLPFVDRENAKNLSSTTPDFVVVMCRKPRLTK